MQTPISIIIHDTDEHRGSWCEDQGTRVSGALQNHNHYVPASRVIAGSLESAYWLLRRAHSFLGNGEGEPLAVL